MASSKNSDKEKRKEVTEYAFNLRSVKLIKAMREYIIISECNKQKFAFPSLLWI